MNFLIRLICCSALALSLMSAQAGFDFELKQGRVKVERAWFPHWLLESIELDSEVEIRLLGEDLVREMYLRENSASEGGVDRVVVDPQEFLSHGEVAELQAIIEKHRRESALPIYLYVFGAGQEALGHTPKMVYESRFQQQRAVVIFYFYGDARSALGYVHGGKDGEADPYEVAELFRKSGRAASQSIERKPHSASEEMRFFVSDVSRRIFWIENKLIHPDIQVQKVEETAESPQKSTMLGAGGDFFRELQSDPEMKRVWYALLGVVLLCVALVARFIYKRKKLYRFPEPACSVRLGAENGAEVSELIEFSSVKTSLDDQRISLKDSDL